MLWGLAWVLMAYSLAPIEFSVGFSLAFNIVSLLLLTALIAFYCEWRVFYSLSAPPLIFLLFEEHWVRCLRHRALAGGRGLADHPGDGAADAQPLVRAGGVARV